MTWSNDFNTAKDPTVYEVIPTGTLVKVRMTITPGGYDDPSQGWTDGFCTCSSTTGSVYLDCVFVVLDGKYASRKIWSMIGLHSPKGPKWAERGRTLIKSILNSAHGISNQDTSADARSARCISGLGDLDGITFVAMVSVEKDQNGEFKNIIKIAITPDHQKYSELMGTGWKNSDESIDSLVELQGD